MKIVSKYFRGYRLVIMIIVLLIYIGSSMCNTSSNIKEDKAVYGANDNYIGSNTCFNCHKEIYDSYTKTPHYKTSALMNGGKLADALYTEDSVIYTDKLYVNVHKEADGFYQSAYSRGLLAASHRVDMVIGSGKKGQTFLFNSDDKFYQLPLSWSVEARRWVNSPGYPADKAMFNRIVYVKCFECHATYANEKLNDTGQPVFDSSQMVLSISCETCHGPGKKHVQYHNENPADKKGNYIINTTALIRQQQLDACASCHSGLRENMKPPFSFLPGNKLDEFFKPAYNKDSNAKLDVHGNQYELLSASKCFKQSIVLNCSSCHNVHQKESNSLQLFAQRCMNCHNEGSHNFCTVKNTDKQTLINKCIDCHMPKQESGTIMFNTGNERKPLYELIRTHLIGVYKDQNVLSVIKKK